jgi:ankyrin repeat protein
MFPNPQDALPLPLHPDLEQYKKRAKDLVKACKSDAIRAWAEEWLATLARSQAATTPQLLAWITSKAGEVEQFARRQLNPCALSGAQFVIARSHGFESWPKFSSHLAALARRDSAISKFEQAADAIAAGDATTLRRLLRENPALVTARSTREHRATLLHYISANGVESYRQKSPRNAVAIAKILLEAGADVDARADVYRGQYNTMSLLVSSSPPAEAGVQVPLVETLLDFGAAVDGSGSGPWHSPVMTALVFNFREAAEALVGRGARTDNLAIAAGLGRLSEAQKLLSAADALTRHRALALAAQLGQVEIVRLLLDAGEDPNRYNPADTHAHSTPLHQAVSCGRLEVVRLLVERGARLDIEDTIYHGTPLGWAQYCRQPEIEQYLRTQSGT